MKSLDSIDQVKQMVATEFIKNGWFRIDQRSFDNTTAVAYKRFDSICVETTALVYFQTLDNRTWTIKGDFQSEAQNVLSNIGSFYLYPQSKQDEVEMVVAFFVIQAQKAISEAFSVRMLNKEVCS